MLGQIFRQLTINIALFNDNKQINSLRILSRIIYHQNRHTIRAQTSYDSKTYLARSKLLLIRISNYFLSLA